MTLQEDYVLTQSKLTQIKDSLLDQAQFSKGDLVQDEKTKKVYRVMYLHIQDDGDVHISVEEIKNNRINWQSCSAPVFKMSEGFGLTKVDWEFDKEAFSELFDEWCETDSISVRDALYIRMETMIYSCYHDWDKPMFEDTYSCNCCGVTTKKVGDNVNIDTMSVLPE